MEEVVKEAKSRVRVAGEVRESFWTARRMKYGCLLSSLLFNILMVDTEEKMRKVKWRGVKIRKRKRCTRLCK